MVKNQRGARNQQSHENDRAADDVGVEDCYDTKKNKRKDGAVMQR